MHTRRIRAFRGQIAHYKYKDILFLESIERLVYEKQYSFNEYYLLENSAPTEQDIIYHLENVIYMLNKYDNYEVAVVNRKKYENFTQICCMVKENCSVFIETYNKKIYQALSSDSYDSEINLFVKEKEALNAFHDYFLMIWNDIPNESKNKDNIIEWLGSLIENLNAQQ